MANSQDPKTVAPQGGAPTPENAPAADPAVPSQEPKTDVRAAAQQEADLRAQIADQHMPPAVPDQPNAGKDYVPETDTEKAVYRPTSKPDEPITYGLNQAGQLAVPPDAYRWFPALQAASQQPDAPPQLAVMARLLSANLQH